MGPLLTMAVAAALEAGRRTGRATVTVSLDLGRSQTHVATGIDVFVAEGRDYPYPQRCRPRTVYYFDGREFVPAARFDGALRKLVPTDWGPPTFEIDGIKMLPTAHVSPTEDAERKVQLVEPRGRRILDTCGGLGYFAGAALAAGAAEVLSYEKSPTVLWLRSLNPWSPGADPRLIVTEADVTAAIDRIGAATVGAILHDPPRFGIAGELYSLDFYAELARVLVRRGRLFHYTGRPNQLSSGRDVPREVCARLARVGFAPRVVGDGVLAVRD